MRRSTCRVAFAAGIFIIVAGSGAHACGGGGGALRATMAGELSKVGFKQIHDGTSNVGGIGFALEALKDTAITESDQISIISAKSFFGSASGVGSSVASNLIGIFTLPLNAWASVEMEMPGITFDIRRGVESINKTGAGGSDPNPATYGDALGPKGQLDAARKAGLLD